MVELIILGPILTIVFLIIISLVVIFFGKGITWLIINSVIGLVALMIVNLLPIINITLNIWSILIVAFGGIIGLILLIILDLLKIAF